MQLIMQSKLY